MFRSANLHSIGAFMSKTSGISRAPVAACCGTAEGTPERQADGVEAKRLLAVDDGGKVANLGKVPGVEVVCVQAVDHGLAIVESKPVETLQTQGEWKDRRDRACPPAKLNRRPTLKLTGSPELLTMLVPEIVMGGGGANLISGTVKLKDGELGAGAGTDGGGGGTATAPGGGGGSAAGGGGEEMFSRLLKKSVMAVTLRTTSTGLGGDATLPAGTPHIGQRCC